MSVKRRAITAVLCYGPRIHMTACRYSQVNDGPRVPSSPHRRTMQKDLRPLLIFHKYHYHVSDRANSSVAPRIPAVITLLIAHLG
jgi:hypothetical protein